MYMYNADAYTHTHTHIYSGLISSLLLAHPVGPMDFPLLETLVVNASQARGFLSIVFVWAYSWEAITVNSAIETGCDFANTTYLTKCRWCLDCSF